MTKNPKIGTVYLVGAGPGDPGLLTLRAQEVLSQAQVVYYDHLVHREILKFCPQAQCHYVGKVAYQDRITQGKIQEQLLQAAKKYSVVVRLKGGDPFIFGRGGEEAEFLVSQNIPFEVVPGVSSAMAVPAYAGIPLTHRDFNSSVTFVTGHEEGDKSAESPGLDWEALAREKTLVFLMGVKTLEQNFQKLIKYGKSPQTPAAMIEWGTYPQQRIVVGTLQTLPKLVLKENFQPPSIAVVGEVVELRKKLAWLERRPLFGKKILITRARQQASELKKNLENFGAQVLEFPTLEIQPPKDFSPLDQAIENLGKYDWILWTSVNGVDAFFERLRFLKKDIRCLGQVKLASVGPATTARLESLGLQVLRQPESFTTDALGQSFKTEELQGCSFLLPRAEVAREAIVEDLRARGAKLEVVSAYRAVQPQYDRQTLQELFEKNPPHLLTFASSSTAKNFYEILKPTPYLEKVLSIPTIVIGPVTSQAARELGFNIVAMPEKFTIEGLVQTVLGYCGGAVQS